MSTRDYPTGLRYRPLLDWPGPMTKSPRRSPFDSTVSATMGVLRRELEKLNARNVVAEIPITEADLRIDGGLRANASPRHQGVVLSFETQQGALAFPCDSFDRFRDNLRGIALSLEALRKIDRYGVTRHAEQYTGWKALEASTPALPFHDRETARAWLEARWANVADKSYADLVRRAQRETHPDRGGDAALFALVMEAERLIREA